MAIEKSGHCNVSTEHYRPMYMQCEVLDMDTGQYYDVFCFDEIKHF